MAFLNKFNINATSTPSSPGVVLNVNPDVVTGTTGNNNALDVVTPITLNATYVDEVVSKLVSIYIPSTGITDSVNNYITVNLTNLGINGKRPVMAASLLGIYDANSVTTNDTTAGDTPSFIGIWDKISTNIVSLSVVNSKLILRIPYAQKLLFANKTAQILIYYSNSAGE
jgi:hypothetical protein